MPSPPWRLIHSGTLNGALNMALDQALLEAVAAGLSPPVLRLYRWSPPTVTLGYAPRGPEVVTLAACREPGFAHVPRVTGGRAVLHHREVTYAVISPERSELFPGGIVANYRVIAGVLQATLESFGLATDLSSGRSHSAGKGTGVQSSACFTAPAVAELVHRGCKVTGSAQKRQGGVFLQHGSIPVDLDLEQLFYALDTRGEWSKAEGARLLARKVGWINRWRATPVTVVEVETRLAGTFADRLGIRFESSEPNPAEWLRTCELAAQRYDNPVWTLAGIAG
jgi:lipoate-protein ligase A